MTTPAKCSTINTALYAQQHRNCKTRATGIPHKTVCETTTGTSDEFQICRSEPIKGCKKGAQFAGWTDAARDARACAEGLGILHAGRKFSSEKVGEVNMWFTNKVIYRVFEQRTGPIAR